MKTRLKIYFRLSLILIIALTTIQKGSSAEITGTLSTWHKVVLSFNGPSTSELAIPNPFTDYRLDVTFTGPSDQEYKVPGFYAADGNAAESSTDTGSIWRVNFCTDEMGTWNYEVSFVSGDQIAAEITGGVSAEYFDGETGSFSITENTDTDPKDFRNKGKLVYTGEHFLRFTESGEYFVKAGANSPEVFLEYAEFDSTPSNRLYSEHIADWETGDPTWQDGKGKGIIGVVNYLSSLDINAYYFLTMNAYGDGKKAWPWVHGDSIVRYDCSKLDQWDILFEHMISKGIMVHFVLTETENESYFEVLENGEPGGFANSRKIYYREMLARYGYLPAVTWDIGEENGWDHADPYQVANTDQQRKDACDRIRELCYYKDHISVHNGPSSDDYIYDALLGHTSHTGPAFQWDNSNNIYAKILEWRTKSADADHKWVVSLDEPYTNPEFISIKNWRKENVWPCYMAGGAGIELYIGAGLDLQVQDFRRYEDHYNVMSLAANFFRTQVPFASMAPDDQIAENGRTLNYEDSIYVAYFKNAANKTVNLPEGNYELTWFDPRLGGDFEKGQVWNLEGGIESAIGSAPSDPKDDWICKINKRGNFSETFSLIRNPSGWEFTEGKGDLTIQDTVEVSFSDELDPLIEVQLTDPDLMSLEWLRQNELVHQYVLTLKVGVNALPPGSYDLSVSFNSDSASSLLVPFTLTIQEGINALASPKKSKLGLALLSNTTSNEIEFIGNLHLPVEVNVFNMNGRLVFQKQFTHLPGVQIGIGHLQKGSYVIRLETSIGSDIYRFLKI